MNFKNSLFSIFIASILCSFLPKNNLAFGEYANNKQEISDRIVDRFSTDGAYDNKIIDSKDITHILIGARIITRFSPQNSQGEKIEITQLASSMGYDHFNWVNYVERDPHGIVDRAGNKMLTPYNDPPAGGYRYDKADKLPFYWDVVKCDRCNLRHHFQNHNNLQQFSLVFEDAPADYRLQSGEAVEFLTSLVGVREIDTEQNKAEWEILHTFRWKLTNPHANYSQVSLIDTNVNLSQLDPLLFETMLADGTIVPTSTQISGVADSSNDVQDNTVRSY